MLGTADYLLCEAEFSNSLMLKLNVREPCLAWSLTSSACDFYANCHMAPVPMSRIMQSISKYNKQKNKFRNLLKQGKPNTVSFTTELADRFSHS